MKRFRGWLWLIAICATTSGLMAASSDALYKQASDAFTGSFYQRADGLCAEFAQKYPSSPHLPDIVLLQARSRLELSNYAGAIQLLSTNQNAVGAPKDKYVFWMGEARLREGKLTEANDFFARVLKEFPLSPLRSQAAVKQAMCAARQNKWGDVVSLLAATNGVFQHEVIADRAGTNAGSAAVLQGYFLLAEGCLNTSNFVGARSVLEPLGRRSMARTDAWAWNYLRCRVQRASGDLQGALATTTNLTMLAADAGTPALQAESAAMRGEILEQLNRWDDAIAAYTNNLSANAPLEGQREAVLKTAQLSIAKSNAEEGANILERFAKQIPTPAAADLAWLKSGELRLRDFLPSAESARSAGTNAVFATNRLDQAIPVLQAAVKQTTNAAVLADAHYALGWCYWFQERIAQSRDAFAAAAEQLRAGAQRAKARLKLADADFRLNQFAGALTNYNLALKEIPAADTNDASLIEPALYQTVRAALAAGDLASASNALRRVITEYPNSFAAGSATLLYGQKLGDSGTPSKAREVFADFIKQAPDSPLKPEAEFAIARAYEQDANWPKAVETYTEWLNEFTNRVGRAEAMFYRGQALFHAGDETNAYACFTNFVAEFPKHPLAGQAQWSIADRYFQSGAYLKAENDFQLVALNWPGTELAYQALMMAGRAAYLRQGWSDARAYFEKVLTNDCPPQLHFSALFADADTIMSQVSTNKEADYVRASGYFDTICREYSTNYLATLACGEKAMCLLQLARDGIGLTNAAEAFRAVITNHVYADGHAISVAKVGLGLVLEKQAAAAAPPEQLSLRLEALGEYLDVLDGRDMKDGDGDEFWTREAAMSGVRLATEMQEWQKVINFCDRIKEKVPSAAPSFEDARQKAVDNLTRGKIAGRD